MEHGEHISTLRTRVRPPNERMHTLAALIVLFIGILLLFSILLYTHCYLRRRQTRRPRQRIYLSASDVPKAHHGLDARVLSSLPVFTFSAAESNHPVECAVCLSEFEEDESGRILPKCKHSFHIDCIDMWFYSHSTCPLCRATVEEHHPDQPADPELLSSSVSDVVSPEHKEQVALAVPVRLMEDRIGAADDDGNSSEVIGSTSASPTTRSLPMITRMLSLKIRVQLRSQRIMKETTSCGGPNLEAGEDNCRSSSSGTVDSLTSFSLHTI